jgi:hypothetical protein
LFGYTAPKFLSNKLLGLKGMLDEEIDYILLSSSIW